LQQLRLGEEKKEEDRKKKKPQDKNMMSASATQGSHNEPLDPFPFLGGCLRRRQPG